ALHVPRIAVHLVHEEVPGGHGAKAYRAVGAGHDQDTAREVLGQDRVAGIPATGGRYALPELGTVLDLWIDALAGVPLGELHGRRHGEHRTRGDVDDIADPVVAGAFGCADLAT